MGKILRSGFFQLAFLIMMGLFVYLLIQLLLDRNDMPWKMDFEYSRELTVKSKTYEHVTGFNIADTVDGLRIYKERRTHYEWYGLKELFEKELVFESRDKAYIRKFVLAAQERMDTGDTPDGNYKPSIGCGELHSRGVESVKFYVVMFDNTFKRAGYFMLVLCEENEEEPHMEILLADKSGFGPIFYYNEALVPILRDIHIYKQKEKWWQKEE